MDKNRCNGFAHHEEFVVLGFSGVGNNEKKNQKYICIHKFIYTLLACSPCAMGSTISNTYEHSEYFSVWQWRLLLFLVDKLAHIALFTSCQATQLPFEVQLVSTNLQPLLQKPLTHWWQSHEITYNQSSTSNIGLSRYILVLALLAFLLTWRKSLEISIKQLCMSH